MSTIKILKGSRRVEFPEGMTKGELVSIILKFAPRIANDEDKTPYTIAGFDPSDSNELGSFDELNSLLSSAMESKNDINSAEVPAA